MVEKVIIWFLINLLKKNDAFIINSYLPLREEIKLELSLGQWPQMWKRLEYKIEKSPNQQLRKKLTSKILKKSDDNLENALSFLLFELLPVCYLEGFTDLQKITEKLPWPKSPKFIFTSNNFHTDEIFKLWSAIKVERGTKYYIGQHGNNYFIKKIIIQLKRKMLINSSHGVGIMDQLIINQDLYLIQQVRKK